MLIAILRLLVLDSWFRHRSSRLHILDVWSRVSPLLHYYRRGGRSHGTQRSDRITIVQHSILIRRHLVCSVRSFMGPIANASEVTVFCSLSVSWVGGNGCTGYPHSRMSSKASWVKVSTRSVSYDLY